MAALMDRNFLDYASYVICERAIPNLTDGLKPVQRRILYSLWQKYDKRFVKVASVVGHTMQYHPHGDASIGDALVNLANRGFLIEKQGNFGNMHTGDSAAAARYIECRLSPIAVEELFDDELTRFIPSYDGRNMEPVELPCKLPLLLLLGAEGIAVGMSTRILPHNFKELLEAQIAILKGESFTLLPDFQQGGIMDPRDYDNGNGTLRVRARIEHRDPEHVFITELPYGTNTESLIASIEDAVGIRNLPILSINNYTSEKVEIELVLKPGADLAKLDKKLFAFTNCEVILNSSIIVLKDRRPVQMTAEAVLRENTSRLLELLKLDLIRNKNRLMDQLHARTLRRIFVEERIYQSLESCTSIEQMHSVVRAGIKPFEVEFLRDVSDEDVETLLSIRMKQISEWDMDNVHKKIRKNLAEIDQIDKRLKSLKSYTLRKLRGLLKMFNEGRRTSVASFAETKRRDLTAGDVKVVYERESGYLGFNVKGDQVLACSPYDKVVVVWRDGRCKSIKPPDKLFVDSDVVYFGISKTTLILTIIYRLGDFTFLKRFRFSGAVLDRIYRCVPRGAVILHVSIGTPEKLYVKYKKYPGILIEQQYFMPAEIPLKQVQGPGTQMTSKEIECFAVEKPGWWDDAIDPPKGVFLDMF